jgi:hypothetical protein
VSCVALLDGGQGEIVSCSNDAISQGPVPVDSQPVGQGLRPAMTLALLKGARVQAGNQLVRISCGNVGRPGLHRVPRAQAGQAANSEEGRIGGQLGAEGTVPLCQGEQAMEYAERVAAGGMELLGGLSQLPEGAASLGGW